MYAEGSEVNLPTLSSHDTYMKRCLELALRGAGQVAPNPMVGCVIVHDGKIIAEGWHRYFGAMHAEPDAISKITDEQLLKECTLYVNLEPCSHWGKTPPCANLIIQKQIPKVVIGSGDPHAAVDGKGIELLRNEGIEVTTGILKKECEALNRRFFTFHRKKRPYVILKWAKTKDGFMAPENGERTQISSHAARVLLHKWRGEEQGILIGSRTAMIDKPALDTRFYPGKNPVKIYIDPELKAGTPADGIVYCNEDGDQNGLIKVKLPLSNSITFILHDLYSRNIISILVEGGADTLSRFIKEEHFDEVRIIRSKKIEFGSGLKAPELNITKTDMIDLPEDMIEIYRRTDL